MPNLLLAFMAIFVVSCASTTETNMRKSPVNDSYYFDAMSSRVR